MMGGGGREGGREGRWEKGRIYRRRMKVKEGRRGREGEEEWMKSRRRVS